MSSHNEEIKAVTMPKKKNSEESSKIDEAELNKLAEAELLKEAKTLANIADVEGALGWKKRRTMRTNKVFLQQTLRHTVSSNKRKNVLRESK